MILPLGMTAPLGSLSVPKILPTACARSSLYAPSPRKRNPARIQWRPFIFPSSFFDPDLTLDSLKRLLSCAALLTIEIERSGKASFNHPRTQFHKTLYKAI